MKAANATSWSAKRSASSSRKRFTLDHRMTSERAVEISDQARTFAARVGATVDEMGWIHWPIPSGESVVFPQEIAGASIALSNQRPTRLEADAPIKRLRVDARGMQPLFLSRGDFGEVWVTRDLPGLDVFVDGSVQTLRLIGPGFRLRRLGPATATLVIDNCQLIVEGPASLTRLEYSGDCTVAGSAISADTVAVAEGAILRGSIDCRLLMPLSPSGRIARGHFREGTVTVREALEPSLEIGDTTLNLYGSEGSLDNTTVAGYGIVTLSGRVRGLTVADGSRIEVQLAGAAQVTQATGPTVLRASRGSTCLGRQDAPLVLLPGTDLTEADVQHVDIYNLRVADIPGLRRCERLAPALPSRSWRDWQHPARKREDAMVFPGDSQRERDQQRAYFWASMSALLKEKHAPGSTQSEVRLAAVRARRKSLPLGRERLLLWLFSLIGYGERVVLPLAVFLLLCLPAAFWLQRHAALPTGWLHEWYRLIQQPLALFHVLSVPTVTVTGQVPLAEVGVVDLIRAVGVVLIGFSVLAIRRITRPE